MNDCNFHKHEEKIKAKKVDDSDKGNQSRRVFKINYIIYLNITIFRNWINRKYTGDLLVI